MRFSSEYRAKYCAEWAFITKCLRLPARVAPAACPEIVNERPFGDKNLHMSVTVTMRDCGS